MQQQQGLHTLRRLNEGKSQEVEHQLSGQIQMKPSQKQQKQLLTEGTQEQHGQSCRHKHGKGHEGHDHAKKGHHKQGKNYSIMIYTIFTCLSCLYLQTQHLNPYRGDRFSYLLTYLTWFDVAMCLWSYVQTYRIRNTVKKLGKLLSVDTVQNKIIDPNYLLTGRHCQKCNYYKLPRVSHCSTCGECIYKLDHHCMWTQTCIGHCNQRAFILFCVYMAIGVIQFWISTYRTASFMIGGCDARFFTVFEPGVYILWAITCLSAGVVGIMIFGLTISHGMMICTNFTTLDSMKQKVMPPFPFVQWRSLYHQDKTINTFNRGQIQNLKSLFGSNILTFWMPLGRQIQNEFIIEPMNPQPTKLQLMQYTTLYQQQLNLQKQVERVIPSVRDLYKGKRFILDGNQMVL